MTMREAEEFIASVPWRAVRMVEVGDTGKTPDPHEYVIKDWREVDTSSFDAFVRLIRARGYRATYRAPYRPDYVMTNHYLELDGWCYWFIYPDMLNRERAEHRKHEPILSTHSERPDAPFDLTLLNAEERQLWDEFFADPHRDGDSPLIRVWGFGHACMLELGAAPDVVNEYLREHDPDNLIRQYLDNVRQAREGRP